MRAIKFIFFVLLMTTNAFASPPSRIYNYVTGTTIQSAAVSGNENAIFNYLQAGVDTFADGSIVNADIFSGAGISYSKLNLVGGIINADISASAGIAYSKLTLTNSIVNADISSSAAIADSKLAQITTASKVSATSITGLASLPSGAGVIPTANLGSGTANSTTFLRGDQSYANPLGHSAGDILTSAADTERTTTSGSYTKVKEISVPSSGTLRLDWDMKTSNVSGAAYGRIYRNGVAVGTEKSTSSASYDPITDDVSGWAAGDLLQLYIKDATGGGDTTSIRNFRVTVATSYDFVVITN